MTMATALAVALGGAVGALCRVGLTALVPTAFPWATLLANLLGCLLIGFFWGLEMARPGDLTASTRAGLSGGFCGAFTTFSTFSRQTLELAQEGRFAVAVANAGLTLAGALLATLLGFWLASRLRVG